MTLVQLYQILSAFCVVGIIWVGIIYYKEKKAADSHRI